MSKDPEQRALAVRVASAATDVERAALLAWLTQLVELRHSDRSQIQKAKLAIQITLRSTVVWPMVKVLAREVKRLGWDERGVKSRSGIVGAGLGLAVFGTQGAGIAALGTAIGVPLWVVLGAGAYFAPVLIEELQKLLPKAEDLPPPKDDRNVIDVDVKIKK